MSGAAVPACFSLPIALGLGNNGNIVFPYVKGPALFNSDLAIFKTFAIGEKKRLEF